MNEPNQHDSPLPIQTLPTRPAPHSLFIDANGLRPLWRVLIYVCAYLVLRSGFLLLVGELAFSSQHRPAFLHLLIFDESALLMAAFAPALFLLKLEGRSLGAYGLPARAAFGKRFWSGAGWGLSAVSALILSMRILGLVSFGSFALHGFRALKFAIFWCVFFLMVGLYEDFLFRGYSLATFSQVTGFWPAALVSSALFGYIHLGNKGEGWAGALGAAAIGLFFCLTLRRTGSLWFAIGMHMSWDWSETYLYSVPDSGLALPGHLLNCWFHGPVWLTGGSVGPEGSVLLFVLIGMMTLVFDRVYPAKRSVPTGPSATQK
jgi:uncharacterized protein